MRAMEDLEVVAGNGLLHRRAFLRGGAAFAAAMTGYMLSDSVAAQQLADDPWSTRPGTPIPEYGVPSSFEKTVSRTLTNPKGEPRTQHARTPHHLLNGVHAQRLHFVISHSGAPDIDPAKHRLVIHGLVKKPLAFTLDALSRYPMVSRMAFVECGGNSAPLFSSTVQGHRAGAARPGLVRRVDRRHALNPARGSGHRPEGEMAHRRRRRFAALSRSVPVAKALDDAMIALPERRAADARQRIPDASAASRVGRQYER
jgi:sulfane dehydrogenase subunit SoxC